MSHRGSVLTPCGAPDGSGVKRLKIPFGPRIFQRGFVVGSNQMVRSWWLLVAAGGPKYPEINHLIDVVQRARHPVIQLYV